MTVAGSEKNGQESGVYIAGELIDVRPGKTWTAEDGKSHQPWLVAILVGDNVQKIEYRNEADARAAVKDAPERAFVWVRVHPRVTVGAVPAGVLKPEGYLFWRGRSASGATA